MIKNAGIALALGASFALAGAGQASAADLSAPETMVTEVTPLWDVAFGVAFMNDYRSRGISNSDKEFAVQGYAELQALDWFYAGIWASNVQFADGSTDPAAEVDLYGGVRHTFGALTLDAGALYYWYPGEDGGETNYWELSFKPSYAITDDLVVSGTFLYGWDIGKSGGDGFYLVGGAKYTLPFQPITDVSLYVSGEFGKQWLGKTDSGFNPRDYLTWNAGLGGTYKAMTLDVRYIDTDLSKTECGLNTGNRGYCGSTALVKLSFDTAFSKLK
ncbi:uncharacterized protein (TIGR02001 family) [Methylopila capsulata]|uniref:Uncharacterized protein (TIGR02001 family) n=1 Tax=Methylopila capsulata TaxID=61654 RepID=A0A9W6IW47_9HYPH|nr:TorF family putative porin [Methylopila capsulata]MBM7853507.1 uncharacterized protein (TIGR02001 family) [Methylopila capsulata]GLK57278.1 hypothetical protein GCM10008170_32980 [Methylopila capsulata]